MISISKSTSKVHSPYLQYSTLFLMEHPILKILERIAIIKLQKRSESNVLTNYLILQKPEVKQMMEPDNFMK